MIIGNIGTDGLPHGIDGIESIGYDIGFKSFAGLLDIILLVALCQENIA
jgi:hypothetical protein